MAAPLKPERPEAQGVAGRRSTRLAINIPLTISGKDAAGHSFKETTRTNVINKHGAKVATLHQMALGAEIMVENRALGRAAKASVVWLGERRSPKEPVEIGVQLFEAANIWGIEFPPDDWQEGPPTGAGDQRWEKPPAGAISPPARPVTAAPLPAPVAPKPVAPSPPRPAEVSRLTAPRPAPAAAGGGIFPPPAAWSEAALGQLTGQADAILEERVRSFEDRLAKLAYQMGFQTQAHFQDAANRLEENVAGAITGRVQNLMANLEASRAELEALRTQFQQLREDLRAEVEKAKGNIENAGFEALQAALEELQDRVRPELESAAQSFVESTRRRVQEEAEAAAKSSEAVLQENLRQVQSRIQMEFEQLGAEAARKRLAELSEATFQEFQKKAAATFDSLLETTARKFLEQSTREASENLRKLAAQAQEFFAPAVRQQIADAQAGLAEELRKAGAGLVEDAQIQFETLQRIAQESAIRDAQALQKQYLDDVRKKLQDFQDQRTRELEDHLHKGLERQRQAVLKQVQKVAEQSTEQAIAAARGKAQQVAQEVFSEATRQANAHAAALKNWEDEALGRLEAQAQQATTSIATSLQASTDHLDGLKQGTLENLRRESDNVLVGLQGRLQQAASALEQKGLETIQSRFQDFTEKLLEDYATQLRKQTDENIELITEQLNNVRTRVVSEAEEAFRSRIAEIFTSMMHPAAKKPHKP